MTIKKLILTTALILIFLSIATSQESKTYIKINKNVEVIKATLDSTGPVSIAGTSFKSGKIDFTETLNNYLKQQNNLTVSVPITTSSSTKLSNLSIKQKINDIKLVNQLELIDLNILFHDDDTLTYDYSPVEGIDITIKEGIVTLTNINATSTKQVRFSASDGENIVYIDYINIFLNNTLPVNPQLIYKKIYKSSEDANFEFEFYDESDLKNFNISYQQTSFETQQGKWKTQSETISAVVYNIEGIEENVITNIKKVREGKFNIKLEKPNPFRPGKYTIFIELIKDNTTYTTQQDFTWGVLAMNTHKSIYLENDTAFISIAVLNDFGRMVCNADVTLEILNPSNKTTILSTSQGDIIVNPDCEFKGVTELPDYYTYYNVDTIGKYTMHLTAETENGIKSIEDSFMVVENVDFDVIREAPTRIFPPVPYKVNLNIKANKDYNGEIIEYVPSSFEITSQIGLTVNTTGDTKILTWSMELKNNKEYNIGYEFLAPDISPYLYLLGKLKIGNFEEQRNWQIASDDAGTCGGTHDACSTYGTSKTCTAHGCSFSGFCLGTPHACSGFDDTSESTCESHGCTWTSTIIPYTTLNKPANDSIFKIDIFNITLNATVFEQDDDPIDTLIYGVNSTDTNNFYNYLLFKELAVSNGSQVTYNFTALPTDQNSNGLIVLFHLDNNSDFGENDTHIFDFSDSTNNGTRIGDPFYNKTSRGSKFGYGVQFDGGSDDAIRISSDAGINAYPFTFSAWAYKYDDSSTGTILAIVDTISDTITYGIRINNSGQAEIFARSGPLRTAGGTTDITGGWHHIVGVFESSKGKSLYVDGAFVVNLTTSVTFNTDENEDRIEVGRLGTLSPSNEFNGTLDEVAIWNRSLTATEIKDLYRLKADKYFWKVNVSDGTNQNESETREFIVQDDHIKITSPITCDDLSSEAIKLKQGYDCAVTGFTCVGLNTNLNITSTGILSLNSSCNILFNTSIGGEFAFFIEGELNQTGANITATSNSNKFNFTSFTPLPIRRTSYGNFTYANFTQPTNLTDLTINFENVHLENITVLLNSTDIVTYTIGSGSLERKFRLNATVYSSGSTISNANVSAWNVSDSLIFSKLTSSDGSIFFNLTQYLDSGSGKTYWNNYTINTTKSGYFDNSTSLNITSDTNLELHLTLIDLIEVSSTETLSDIHTRINNDQVFNNLSDATNICKYVSTASINITTNGHLVMETCILEINSSTHGQYFIEVGGLLTSNYSNLSWGSNERRYHFYTTASASSLTTLKNSYIYFAGSSNSDNERGLTLNSENVTFTNNTLSQANTANVELRANNLILADSTFLGPAGITTYNIYVVSNNSIIIDSNISAADASDVLVISNHNITLLNTNHSTHNVQSGGRLYKQWYVNAIVQDDSSNALSGANVTFYNISNSATHSITTNSSGNIDQQNVTEYIVNGTEKTFQTNYTINATHTGYTTDSQSVNLTKGINLTFTIENPTPYTTLNEPKNSTIFELSIFNITTNATINDQFDDLIDVLIYGINSSSTADFYKHGLIYQRLDVNPGAQVSYNWTAPVTIPDADTFVLFHMDNNEDFGEGSTSFTDTSFKSPNQTGSPSNDWTSGNNITVSDNSYATETTIGETLDTSNYSFNIPAGFTIKGIEIQLEGHSQESAGCT